MNKIDQPKVKHDVESLALEKFNELQFATLRKEIEETKSRQFLLTIGGAALVPAAKLFSSTANLGEITLLLPLLVCVLLLLFLSEHNALMRTGSYILHYIEGPLYGYDNQQRSCKRVGWERYLQGGTKQWQTRLVDKLATWAFMLLALGYYMITAYMAYHWTIDNHYTLLADVVVGVYSALLIGMSFLVGYSIQSDTQPQLGGIEVSWPNVAQLGQSYNLTYLPNK